MQRMPKDRRRQSTKQGGRKPDAGIVPAIAVKIEADGNGKHVRRYREGSRVLTSTGIIPPAVGRRLLLEAGSGDSDASLTAREDAQTSNRNELRVEVNGHRRRTAIAIQRKLSDMGIPHSITSHPDDCRADCFGWVVRGSDNARQAFLFWCQRSRKTRGQFQADTELATPHGTGTDGHQTPVGKMQARDPNRPRVTTDGNAIAANARQAARSQTMRIEAERRANNRRKADGLREAEKTARREAKRTEITIQAIRNGGLPDCLIFQG